MNYICLFLSYESAFKKLNDEQFGQLVRAAIVYARTGERQTFKNPTQDAYFDIVITDIDTKIALEKNRTRAATDARIKKERDDRDERDVFKERDDRDVHNERNVTYYTKQDYTKLHYTNTNTNNDKNAPEKATKKSFNPPSVEEVTEYCKQRDNGIDPELFCAYYAKQGWTLNNGRPMKDWKSAVVTWEKRDKERATPKPIVQTPKKNGFLAMLEKWDDDHKDVI